MERTCLKPIGRRGDSGAAEQRLVAIGRGEDESATPFLVGDGPMARRVREFDWASTPLGPIADWPLELKTVVGFMLESHFPAAVVWGPGLVNIYNDAFRPILGAKPEALGRCFAEVWAEVWDEVAPIAERAFAGQATFIEDLPLVVERSGRPEQAWFTFCYSPLRLADGKVGGFMDTVVETTAAVRARQDVAVLNEELAHRLKNTLSMVQAIAAQTLKSVESKDALGAFNARLAALGRAHEVLLGRAFAEASLRRAVDTALAPLDVLGRIAVTGPDFVVGARTTVSLSLILHELATNAVKYGALSVPGGRVSLSWTTDDGVFRMRWRESGGPEVHTPERDGFGARLIDAGLGVGGRVSRRYPPDGFEADLEAPLQTLAE